MPLPEPARLLLNLSMPLFRCSQATAYTTVSQLQGQLSMSTSYPYKSTLPASGHARDSTGQASSTACGMQEASSKIDPKATCRISFRSHRGEQMSSVFKMFRRPYRHRIGTSACVCVHEQKPTSIHTLAHALACMYMYVYWYINVSYSRYSIAKHAGIKNKYNIVQYTIA